MTKSMMKDLQRIKSIVSIAPRNTSFFISIITQAKKTEEEEEMKQCVYMCLVIIYNQNERIIPRNKVLCLSKDMIK